LTKRLWTISGFATELDLDRRTVASGLRDVPADGTQGKHAAWFMSTALRALGFIRGGGSSDYEAERTRYMKLRADALAQEAAVRAGELVPIGPLSQARGLQFKVMRDFLMRLPAQLPPLLVGQPIAKTESILREAIHEALQAIANCEIRVTGAAATVGHSGDNNDGAAAGTQAGESAAAANGQ
jgi:hypothetical protein